MDKLTIQGFAEENGTLSIYEKLELEDFIKQNKGKRLVITINEAGTKANPNYYKYYWGIIIPKFRKKLYEYGNSMTSESINNFWQKIVLQGKI